MNDLETIKAAYMASIQEFESCKTYCLANSAICAWSVLWLLRDNMEELKVKFISATRNALRKSSFKPTADELEQDKEFMNKFYKAADADDALCTAYFFNPETTLEKYYDLITK